MKEAGKTHKVYSFVMRKFQSVVQKNWINNLRGANKDAKEEDCKQNKNEKKRKTKLKIVFTFPFMRVGKNVVTRVNFVRHCSAKI